MANLTDIDIDAMKRAIEIVRNENRARRRQIESMLASRSFERVGKFASFYCQMDSLHLDPFEVPPCWIDNIDVALITPDDARNIPGSARLLRRMLTLGISRYEPDPLRALERAEAEPA